MLDLSACSELGGASRPMGGLVSLQALNLSKCEGVRELTLSTTMSYLQTLKLSGCTGLKELTLATSAPSLKTLDLSGCERLAKLTLAAGTSSLQTLNLSGCKSIRRFAPLECLLPTLRNLALWGCEFEDLPREVVSSYPGRNNFLNQVRAHYEDLKSGLQHDAEIKILFLGNGGVGKTQLCRRLCGKSFDPNIPTTHGVQLGEMPLAMKGFPEAVRLNLWDFGGQDIYHGLHALFLQGQAVLLILWMPDLERESFYMERSVTLRHRPLSYWLDYVRAFAGTKGEVLVIQSKCDTSDQCVPDPPTETCDFISLRKLEVSARTGLNLDRLHATIEAAVRNCLHERPLPPIGASRVAVRDRLRQMLREDHERPAAQRKHCFLTREEFNNLCIDVGGISDPDALLHFLHLNGVIFYRAGLFDERIVLDQDWALEAMYMLFDRDKMLPLLRGHGRFTRRELERLVWTEYTRDRQQVFLDMLESCGICFRLRQVLDDSTENDIEEEREWEYLAPELLPEWSDAEELLLGRLQEGPPAAEAEARYAILHEGILRGYLSTIGQHAKDAAVYWKYGCWFYEKTTKSQVLIEAQWTDPTSQTSSGAIRFRAWGDRAQRLLEPLLTELEKLPVGQPPQITWQGIQVATDELFDAGRTGANGRKSMDSLVITNPPFSPLGPPRVFVSYSWGDDSSAEARQRGQIVEDLCEVVQAERWQVVRDKTEVRYGDLISSFMKMLGQADLVIVVLSAKYLRSPYCMTELHDLYRNARQEKQAFLGHIIPLVLDDARIGTPEERVDHAKHWEARYQKLKPDLDHLSPEDFQLYQRMKDWCNHVGKMLTYINDELHPRGSEAIVKDDFAALREMLRRARSRRRS